MEHIQPKIGNFQCFSFKKLHGQKLIQVFLLKFLGRDVQTCYLSLPVGVIRMQSCQLAARKCTRSDQSNDSHTPNDTKTKATLNHREMSKDGRSSYTTEQRGFNLPPSIITSPPPPLLSVLWLSIAHPLSHAPPLP